MRWLGYCLLIAGVQLVCANGLRADDQAEAKVVLDKAIKAVGAETKLARLKTGTLKGKLSAQIPGGGDIGGSVDLTWNGLDQYRMEANISAAGRNEAAVMVINKDKGWFQSNGRTEEAPDKQIVPAVKDAFYAIRLPQVLPTLRDKEFKLSPLGEMKIDSRPAVGLLITHKDRKDARLYFDKETGLPVKSEITISGPNNQDVPLEVFYSDAKEFDGVKHPTKVKIKFVEGTMTIEAMIEVSDVKAQDKADESLFGKP